MAISSSLPMNCTTETSTICLKVEVSRRMQVDSTSECVSLHSYKSHHRLLSSLDCETYINACNGHGSNCTGKSHDNCEEMISSGSNCTGKSHKNCEEMISSGSTDSVIASELVPGNFLQNDSFIFSDAISLDMYNSEGMIINKIGVDWQKDLSSTQEASTNTCSEQNSTCSCTTTENGILIQRIKSLEQQLNLRHRKEVDMSSYVQRLEQKIDKRDKDISHLKSMIVTLDEYEELPRFGTRSSHALDGFQNLWENSYPKTKEASERYFGPDFVDKDKRGARKPKNVFVQSISKEEIWKSIAKKVNQSYKGDLYPKRLYQL